MNDVIKEMERYAEANNVPIIEPDSILFIKKYIKLNDVKKILEIGTAIGYSAILMATTKEDVEVTTIERDDKRYREAVKNINEIGLDNRIEVVFNDALDVNLAGYKYDLIFIDAAKSQLIKYFEKFKNYLNPGGVIITDNIKFHGLVAEKDKIESKNVRQLVDKIEDYKEYLQNNDEFITKFYDVGDGLAVSFRRDNESIKGVD
jgi:predicted O-methyltransferase YrrM